MPGVLQFGLKKLNFPLVAGFPDGALSIWANVAQAPCTPLMTKTWKPTSPTVTVFLAPPSKAWMVWKRPEWRSASVRTFHAALTSTAPSGLSLVPAGSEITLVRA